MLTNVSVGFCFKFVVVLLGDSGVGKSSILAQYKDGTFDMNSKPTIGVELSSKRLVIQDKSVKASIWDTGN